MSNSFLKASSLFCACLLSANLFAQPFTPEQEVRIKALVRETLIAQPDILSSAAEVLEAQIQERAQLEQKTIIQQNSNALFNDPMSPRIGAEKTTLNLVYFTDYNCPYCKRFETTLQQIQAKYPAVNLVIKPVPFLGEGSRLAAEYVLTLWQDDPAKFKLLHDAFMTSTARLDEASINSLLAKHKLSDVKVTAKAKDALANNLALSRTLGVSGTPATIIGDEFISGALPFANLDLIVKRHLDSLKK